MGTRSGLGKGRRLEPKKALFNLFDLSSITKSVQGAWRSKNSYESGAPIKAKTMRDRHVKAGADSIGEIPPASQVRCRGNSGKMP